MAAQRSRRHPLSMGESLENSEEALGVRRTSSTAQCAGSCKGASAERRNSHTAHSDACACARGRQHTAGLAPPAPFMLRMCAKSVLHQDMVLVNEWRPSWYQMHACCAVCWVLRAVCCVMCAVCYVCRRPPTRFPPSRPMPVSATITDWVGWMDFTSLEGVRKCLKINNRTGVSADAGVPHAV